MKIINNIKLIKGTFYIANKPIGNVCTKLENISERYSIEKSVDNFKNTSISLTATCRLNKDALAELLGVIEEVKKSCKNRRVIHLLKNNKKRVRKKSLHRMFRMLEKDAMKNKQGEKSV